MKNLIVEYYTFIDCSGRWRLRRMNETDETSQANAERRWWFNAHPAERVHLKRQSLVLFTF